MPYHTATIALAVGPGKLSAYQALPNVSRVSFLMDKKLLQVYQEGSTSVREFDTTFMSAVAFIITGGNYDVIAAQ